MERTALERVDGPCRGRRDLTFLYRPEAPWRRRLARGAETIAWKLKPDTRRLSQGGDREGRCRRCHARIVLSPDDRRQGYCFDCYDSLEVHKPLLI